MNDNSYLNKSTLYQGQEKVGVIESLQLRVAFLERKIAILEIAIDKDCECKCSKIKNGGSL